MPVQVDLDSDLQAFLDELVGSGRYGSVTEAVSDGLRLIQELEILSPELEEKLARGIADADAGRVTPLDEVFDRLDRKYEALSKTAR